MKLKAFSSALALTAALLFPSASVQAQTLPESAPASVYMQLADKNVPDDDDVLILEDFFDEDLLASGLLKEGLRIEDVLVKNFRPEDILAEGVRIEDIENFFGEEDQHKASTLQIPDMYLYEWFSQQPLYNMPFSIYTLTPEEKAVYLALIQQFWPWNYSGMQASEINNAMAGIINTMLEEINQCSRGLAAMEILTNFITGGPKNPKDWAKFIRENHEAIGQVLGQVHKSRMYRACINVAAASHRSDFDMAYFGF